MFSLLDQTLYSASARVLRAGRLPRPAPLLAVVAACCALAAGAVAAQHGEREVLPSSYATGNLRFDMAMNGASFHFLGPTNDAGFPADGTPFIIRGYLYPQGTFDVHGPDSGTNPDGSPEFPDLVVGTWTCRGWHLQDGDAVTGPVVATTQIFDLVPSEPGAQTIVTDGFELADFDLWFSRAIVGGSGRYRNVSGQQRQIYVGFNSSLSFNTSFELRINNR